MYISRKVVAEVRNVKNPADILVDSEGALERRNHWKKPATYCWSGAILLCSTGETLSGVSKFLSERTPACPVLDMLGRANGERIEMALDPRAQSKG